MKVLMLAQFYAPIVGGEERMTESLALSLAARGHEVSVATLRQPGQGSAETRDGIRVHRLPGLTQRLGFLFSEHSRRHAPPLGDPETVRALARVLVREQPDVVHGHNWLAHAYLPLRRRSDAAYVLSLHEYSLVCATKRMMRNEAPCSGPGPIKCALCAGAQYGRLTGPPIAFATAVANRWERHAADLFLPISHTVARYCALEGSGLAYEVMPNFLPDEPRIAAEDPALGALPSGEFILYAGDLTPDKGIHTLLDAHARMQRRVPLVLIGRTVGDTVLAAREDVVQIGPVAHEVVLAAWRRSAVAVAPSLCPEAFGLAALEALAAGVPLVASRIGGLAELVTDGESGLLVRPGDAGELAVAIDRVLSDAALRKRLAKGGTTRAAEFTASAVIPRIEAAYARALSARREKVAA